MAAGVTTLPFDFDIFLRSGSTMKPEMLAFAHGTAPCSSSRPQHGREQPGADDVLALAAQRVREDEVPEFGIALPAARDLRGERRGRPGVHDVELAREGAARGRTPRSRPAHPMTDRRAGRSSAGTMTAPRLPSASSSYQTGMGTPKKRWREISQSPVRPPTQFS